MKNEAESKVMNVTQKLIIPSFKHVMHRLHGVVDFDPERSVGVDSQGRPALGIRRNSKFRIYSILDFLFSQQDGGPWRCYPRYFMGNLQLPFMEPRFLDLVDQEWVDGVIEAFLNKAVAA